MQGLCLVVCALALSADNASPVKWGNNYSDALKVTKAAAKPLLVVVENPGAAGRASGIRPVQAGQGPGGTAAAVRALSHRRPDGPRQESCRGIQCDRVPVHRDHRQIRVGNPVPEIGPVDGRGVGQEPGDLSGRPVARQFPFRWQQLLHVTAFVTAGARAAPTILRLANPLRSLGLCPEPTRRVGPPSRAQPNHVP